MVSRLYMLFYVVAVPATVVLILQTVLLLFGLGHDADSDVDLDHDGVPDYLEHADVGHHDAGHVHDTGLRLFTVRGIVAFFAVGGWAGVAALELGARSWMAILAAFGFGTVSLLLVALFFKWALSLQSNGTIDMSNAVGNVGEVYMTVPAGGGKGKINIVIQERYVEMDAVTDGDRDLKYGERVRVTGMADSNTAVVAAE